MTQTGPTGTDMEDGEDSEGHHGPGEFDQDEPKEVLEKAMASKSLGNQVQASVGSSLKYSQKTQTEQVRIELLTNTQTIQDH